MRAYFEEFVQDLRYTLRMIAQSPAFTILAALSLALGIGCNTAIYSFMDAILLRALPVPHAEELAVVQYHTRAFPSTSHNFQGSSFRDAHFGRVSGNVPYPAYEAMRASNSVFSSMFGFSHAFGLNMLVHGDAALANAEYVTGNFFRTLQLNSAAGRLLDPSDDRPGAAPVAVASFDYARRRFGDVASAAGQPILLNNVPYTLVGVAPPEFFGVYPGTPTELYIPMHSNLVLDARPGFDPAKRYIDRNAYWVQVMGRMRPGVTLTQAQSALAPVFQNFIESTAANEQERGDMPQFYLQAGAGGMDFLRRQYSKPLYFLMAMVGLILAIACANIANLLLARAAGRRREMAVRLSLGAGRARVIRQLLTESLSLAGIGAALGTVVSYWGIRALGVMVSNSRQNFVVNATLNGRVLLVTAAIALGAGLLFGLAPALQSSGIDLTPALKQTRGGDPWSQRRRWWRASLSRVLIVAQFATSLLLLVAAGLFARTLSNLHSITTGFNQDRLLLFQVNAWQVGYRDSNLTHFYQTLRDRISTAPGVRNASFGNPVLLSGSANTSDIDVPGGSPKAPKDVSIVTMGPSYFDTMQIPVLLGRDLDERDLDSHHVLINELFAQSAFGSDNPLGRHFTLGRGRNATDLEVVGVVKNVYYSSLKDEIPPTVYKPCCENIRSIGFAIRTAGDPMTLAASARSLLHDADSRIPMTDVTTQEHITEQGIGQERTFATLCTAFALLAIVIAGVGLYGTMAYTVARRTGEIGIRMALGAQRRRVVWMVEREVLILAALGFAIGLPIAYNAATLVEAFLFGVKARDAATLLIAPSVLLLCAILAGFGPARRASKIDPMTALRED